nr:viral replication protein [Andean potato latent virus]
MSFQTALEALNSTVHRDAATNPILNSVVEPLQQSLVQYPWLLPKEVLPFLLSSGIPNSGLGTTPHPHPTHKVIETFLLYNHWSCLANQPSTIMFMKPQKFQKLRNLNNNFTHLCNYRLTPADTTRYPTTSLHLPNTPVVFMHDALMYFNPAQILDLFLNSPIINSLYCSLIVPPESDFTDLSLQPILYQFSISGQTLHYVPEGHNAGSYNQPLHALDWLKIHSILSRELNLSVTKLDSWGPVHSILIQRNLPPLHPARQSPINQSLPSLFSQHNRAPRALRSQRDSSQHLQSALQALFPPPQAAHALASFKIPECLELPSATFLNQPLRHRLVPLQVYNALFTYTRAVRTLRTSDPAGFVRTQSNKAEYSWVTPNAWDNLQTFALMNAPIRPRVFYEFFLNPFQKLKLHFRQHWKKYLTLFSPVISILVISPQLLPIKSPIPKLQLVSIFRSQKLPFSHIKLDNPLHLKKFLPPKLTQRRNFSIPIPIALGNVLLHLHKINPSLAPVPPILPRFQTVPVLLRDLPPKASTTIPLLALVPTCIISWLHLFSALPLQQIHDLYHTNMHPSQFRLQWDLQPMHVDSPQPFLPYLLPAPTNPSTFPQTPLPVTPPISPPQAQRAVTSLAPSPSPSSPAESEPPTGLVSSSTLPPSSTTHQTPPPPLSPSDDLLQVIPPSSDIPLSIPPDSTVTYTGALNHSISPTPFIPQHPPAEPIIPPLMADPTCAGDVIPFHDAFPGLYFSNTASFPTRIRILPSSNLPVPALNCLLETFSQLTHYPVQSLWQSLCSMLPDCLLDNEEIRTVGLSTDLLTALCFTYHIQCILHTPSGNHPYGMPASSTSIDIDYLPGPPRHFSPHNRFVASAPGSNPSSEPLVREALRFKHNGHFLPFHQAHLHSVSLQHAKNLISNMKNGFDGIMHSISTSSSSSPSPKQQILTLDSICDVAQPRTVPVIHIAGFAGCGKTHPIQKLLATKPFKDFRISTPTNELRSEWKRDMDPSPSNLWRFSTWESSLFKHSSVLIIDEIYKLPRGYLDLSILADPNLKLVFILGDPLQGEYHSTNPHSSNIRLPSEIDRFRRYIDCYCWWTYRLPKLVAELFQIPTFSSEQGSIIAISSHPPGSKNLVNSMSTATSLQQMGHHAITISSSQGITFPEINTILLDRHTNLLSPNNCLVAMTRSRKGFAFVGNLHLASNSFGTSYMFSQALARQPINMTNCFHSFHQLLLLHHPITTRNPRFVAGHQSILPNVHKAHQKLSTSGKLSLPPHIPIDHAEDFIITNPVVFGDTIDPRLPTNHLPPTRLPLHTELLGTNPSSTDSSFPDTLFNTPFSLGLSGETFENLAAHFLPAHDPSLKEILYHDQSSLQFPWLDRPFSLSCQPSSLIAATHSPSQDPTLLPASIKKRLRFRESDQPYQITANDQLLGQHLFSSLCKAYGRSPLSSVPFNPVLFAECISLNEYAQLSSKTRATIVANAQRSDPDWRHTTVKIFAKAQHKVNDGSIFGSWKACQTLALMHDYIILILGPVKKYQRVIDSKDRPPQLYIHCGHTPHQLSSWCQTHLSGQTYLANDYTSFDQSQHGEAVVLELLKMQRLNFPSFFLDLHLHLKTNVQTQFGPLTCMRLTGEPGTYDDNSDYNLAVIFSKYLIHSHPIMISGDDSVICGNPSIHPGWSSIEPILHLKFKTETNSHPLFCGYYVSPLGAVRNPFALFAKLMICIDDCTLDDKILSYLSEFSVGHTLGDSLIHVIPSTILPYQSACHDFFCRNCTPSQKLLLSLDPLPESTILRLILKIKWASKAFFSLLPSKARDLLVSKGSLQSMPFDPKVTQLESELLPFFNSN